MTMDSWWTRSCQELTAEERRARAGWEVTRRCIACGVLNLLLLCESTILSRDGDDSAHALNRTLL